MGVLTIRLPDEELEILKEYCDIQGRNQTEIIREYVRSLVGKAKGKVCPTTFDVSKLPSLPIERKMDLPAIRCVYIVSCGSDEIVYVGATTNLKKRWASHHKYEQCIAMDGDIKIAWVENPARGYLWFEDKAIKRFSPRLNVF